MSCKKDLDNPLKIFLTSEIPSNTPIPFKQDLVPTDKLIHKGMFSPDLQEYYYTVSDKKFEKFDVYMIEKSNGKWSEPKKAFFNSSYSEHGMSFSPDGNTLYFSSTRPTFIDGVPTTWHIWKSEKMNGKWTSPVFVDIPNLKHKLVSHPTCTNSGTLYFHASDLDYSNMHVYRSRNISNVFQEAEKISINPKTGACTPFVSPNENYLIFASLGNQLDLMISFSNENGKWLPPKKLNDTINDFGQGNPYITPDNKFLFYTTNKPQEENWCIKWANLESVLKNN
ncbi:TolB-like translocation protein [Tenacibaculum amylolyticum]|uniref:hypothetical protein n=1 Tax=Tenacibaculum amylolyticum TaxID=104269 RepID=UPI0038B68B4C